MKKKFDLNIKIILLIIIFSSAIGITFNIYNSKGISIYHNPKQVEWAKDEQLIKQGTPDSIQNTRINGDSKPILTEEKPVENNNHNTEPKAVNLKQVFNLFSSGHALFIDARDKWEFAEGHIRGSINIPYYKFDKNDNSLKKLDKSKTIITYCDGDDCEMSKKLANDFLLLGYTKIYYFFGGWKEWTNAKYPIETSELK